MESYQKKQMTPTRVYEGTQEGDFGGSEPFSSRLRRGEWQRVRVGNGVENPACLMENIRSPKGFQVKDELVRGIEVSTVYCLARYTFSCALHD